MILIGVLILISTVLPIFHIFNAFFSSNKICANKKFTSKEQKFSIIIPCFNEETVIPLSIKGILDMNYKNYEVIYINDGSTDKTFEVLKENLDLMKSFHFKNKESDHYSMQFFRSLKYDNFFVVNKENEGKGKSLNVGIHFACSELIVTLDADSVLEKNALNHMNQAFQDNEVAAAGGSIYIMQGYDPKYLNDIYPGKTRRIITLQILDYLKGFFIYKFSLYKQNATAIISGAFGVFRRDILIGADGFRKTLGEDIDITLRIQFFIQNTKKKILYIPQAVCFTQCPESWQNLKRQRIRWQKGFINCLEYYSSVILKTFLYRSLTFHLLFEAFVIGITSSYFTIFSAAAVILSGNTDTVFIFIWYFIARIIVQAVYSACAVYISKKYYLYPEPTMKKVYLSIFLDILVFQMFTMMVYLTGTFSYFWYSSDSHKWNKFERSRINYDFESPGRDFYG